MKQSNPTLSLMFSFNKLHAKLIKRIDSQLSIHGISFSEFMVMHQLSSAPHNSMRRIELAESINLTASGVTRMLAPMEKIKLVEKQANPRDARVSLVKLTEVGHQLYKDALVGFEQAIAFIDETLNKNQTKQLSQLIKDLL